MAKYSTQLANLVSKYGGYLKQSEEDRQQQDQELADRQALGDQLRAARLAQNQADQQAYAARQAAAQNAQQANVVPVAMLRAPKATDRVVKTPFSNYENTSGGVSDLAPIGDILKHIGSGVTSAISAPATFLRSIIPQATGKLGSVSNPGNTGYYSTLQAASDLSGQDIDKKIASVPVVGPALDAAANFVADNATDPTAYLFGSGFSGAKGVSTIDRGADLDKALNTARSVKQAENLTRSSGVLHAADVLPEASRLATPIVENGKLFGSAADRDAGTELRPSWVTSTAADTKSEAAVKPGWVTDASRKSTKIKAAPEEAVKGGNDTAAQAAADSLSKNARTTVDTFVPTSYPNGDTGIVSYSPHEAANLNSAKGISKVTDADWTNFVDNLNSKDDKRFYFGKVSPSLGDDIKASTGLDLSGYNVSTRSTNLIHELKNHGDMAYESQRGQTALTKDFLKELPSIFNNPDSIRLLDTTDYAGRPALQIEKRIDGHAITITGVSDGKKLLDVDSVWIKNEKPPAVSDADIRPQTNTSATIGGLASGDSISQFTENARPLGAQTAAEPYREKTSDFYTNTVKNSPMFTDAEKSMAINQAPKEQIISEKQSLTEARQRLETDFDGEVSHLNKTPMYTGADVDTAMGVTEAYLKEARQTGDYSKAMDWINQVADRAGESGRSLQALQKYSRTPEGMLVQGTKMINDAAKKALEGKAGLTPTGHKLENDLRAIQNALKNPDALSNPETSRKIAQILKGDTDTADQIMRLAESGKGSDAIKSVLMQKYAIPSLTDDDMSRITDLMGEYTKATDPAEKNALAVQVCKIIGNRLPVGFFEKVDQWRYTSMLFNMLTNERNVLGNAASYATREWKNVTGIALERALPVEERTKAILTPADKPLREAAEKAYQSVKFDLESTSKLDFRNMISDNRRIYNTRVLEWLRTSSNWLLDKEDDIGLHKVFTSAFAEGMKARKLTPEFLASDAGKTALRSLQTWASREATRTMFHESSRVAQVLNQLESRSKVGKIFIGGMLPFKQTPIDILKQGARYSPLGLLKGVTYDVAQLRHGDISKLEFIDNLAAGLTGTQLAVVGAWLGSLGLVTTESNASGSAADFQAQQQGYQDYALKIGNKTYTLDWLSPAAMPFFFGAELQKTLFGNESLTTGEKVQQGFGRMLNAMTKVTDPLMNLSMLQSVNDMLNSAKYGIGNAISSTAQDAAQSYVGQYFPSQLGAIARAVTPYKKTSYTSLASPLGKVVEQTGRSAMQKIPGVNLLLPNSIDQWGQPVSSGTPVERILNNFFSPGKLQSAKNDAVNDEVSRLYQSTGDSSALPKTAAGYFTEGGARYDLTSTEKEKYATVLGQTAHDVAARLIGSGEYADLSDHGKALALSRVYSDAAAKAKKLILDVRGVKNSITVGSSKSRNSLYRSIDDWVTD